MKILSTIPKISKFLIRIELHDVEDSNIYENLHIKMKEQGFSKTIRYDDKHFELPRGEYFFETKNQDLSAEDVAREAEVAINLALYENEPGCEYGYIVSKLEDFVLYGLKKKLSFKIFSSK